VRRERLATTIAGATIAIVALVSACGDAVVDGACAPGYALCDGRCLTAASCADARADGTVSDASGDAAGDDSRGDGDGGGDGRSDVVETDGTLPDGAICPPPPFDTATHCGSCDISCSGSTPICKPGTAPGVYQCASPCAPGLLYCGGVCIDPDIDSSNCGGCGVFCPTGLCNGGKCRGAIPGHAVTIGHDFLGVGTSASVAKVLVNAAFLPSHNPVRILGYQEFANQVEVGAVKAILDAGAAASGRTYTLTASATQGDLLQRISIDAFDLVLVYDQPKAPSGALQGVGSAMAPDFASFSETGGVIVTLDGGGGVGEMPRFLNAAGLLDASAHTGVTSLELNLVAPADAIGIGVLSPYQAPSSSVSFTLVGAPSALQVTVVREPKSGEPVVVHRVVIKM
jgi:hypothetical protein